MSCASPGATHHLACDCREAEWAAKLAAAEARREKAISDTVQEFALRRAAEARALRMEKGLRAAADAPCVCVFHPVAERQIWCGRCIARAALAPPPDGEKKGGER